MRGSSGWSVAIGNVAMMREREKSQKDPLSVQSAGRLPLTSVAPPNAPWP